MPRGRRRLVGPGRSKVGIRCGTGDVAAGGRRRRKSARRRRSPGGRRQKRAARAVRVSIWCGGWMACAGRRARQDPRRGVHGSTVQRSPNLPPRPTGSAEGSARQYGTAQPKPAAAPDRIRVAGGRSADGTRAGAGRADGRRPPPTHPPPPPTLPGTDAPRQPGRRPRMASGPARPPTAVRRAALAGRAGPRAGQTRRLYCESFYMV